MPLLTDHLDADAATDGGHQTGLRGPDWDGRQIELCPFRLESERRRGRLTLHDYGQLADTSNAPLVPRTERLID